MHPEYVRDCETVMKTAHVARSLAVFWLAILAIGTPVLLIFSDQVGTKPIVACFKQMPRCDPEEVAISDGLSQLYRQGDRASADLASAVFFYAAPLLVEEHISGERLLYASREAPYVVTAAMLDQLRGSSDQNNEIYREAARRIVAYLEESEVDINERSQENILQLKNILDMK